MKIKKLFNKKIMIIFAIVAMIAIPTSLLTYRLINRGYDFIIVNYSNYISPDVQALFEKEYQISFDNIQTAEESKNMLKNNRADIANTTSYEVVNLKKEGLIKKLDWTRFNIEGITNATEALSLFNEQAQFILTQCYDLNQNNQLGDLEDNLLNYGIPYFLSDLVFAYSGNKIEFSSSRPTWHEIFDKVAQEERFKTNKLPTMFGLDDSRTMYSIASVLEKDDINPPLKASIEDLSNTFNYLSHKFNRIDTNCVMFSNESFSLITEVVTGNMKGSICYNGDALYGAYGGDLWEQGLAPKQEEYHIIHPQNNLVAMDMLVFDNEMSETNLIKAYDMISKLCLLSNDVTDPIKIEESIIYQNFDYVQYTSPSKALNDYILNNYFETEWEKQIYTIPTPNISQIERNLDEVTKSNFTFAWINFTNSLI